MIYNGIDKKKKMLAIFVDLAKAFDIINHEILLKKWHNLGIQDIALSLTKNYLSDAKCKNR